MASCTDFAVSSVRVARASLGELESKFFDKRSILNNSLPVDLGKGLLKKSNEINFSSSSKITCPFEAMVPFLSNGISNFF